MLSILLTSFAGLVTFMVFDYLWLAKIAKDFYLTSLASHVVIKDGSLVPYLPAVPLVYLVGVIAIWVFVLAHAKTGISACMYGALLGFCLYAFYDLTNLATLEKYSWAITIVDTIWGTILFGGISLVMFLVAKALA